MKMDNESISIQRTEPVIPSRYLLVVLTFLLSLLLYIDRACISAATDSIRPALGFSEKQMGWVMSAFALGYALFQTPGGLLADRFGPRVVLAAVVSCWSLFTGLTAAAWGYVSMLVVRFLFGAGEAGAFPTMARAFYTWIPMPERGRVQGINFSGSRLGAAFALPVVAWMIDAFGWRATFATWAVIGFGWALLWYLWFRNDPADHPRVSPAEFDHIRKTRQQAKDDQNDQPKLSAAVLLRSRNMWLAMVQYFCSNFTFFFALTWLFPHLKKTYQLEPVQAGFFAAAPLICGAFGNWFAGGLVDRIYKRNKWVLSRRAPATLGFALSAVGLVASVYMDRPLTAVIFLSIAIFGADMTLPPSWALCIDIGRQHAGAVSGTMNMAGNIGSFVTGLAFPYLKDWTGSVVPFFFLGAGLNLLAVLLWAFVRPDKGLEEY
jgi:ACS family glucarate transporter-like MFS transporter